LTSHQLDNMLKKWSQTPCYLCWLILHDWISYILQVILAKTTKKTQKQIQGYFG